MLGLTVPLFSKGQQVVGIDIGSFSIKICRLKKYSSYFKVQNLGTARVPSGAIVDGTLVPGNIQPVLKRLLENQKIAPGTPVGFSVSGPSVVVKKVSLLRDPTKTFAAQLTDEMAQHIPFDIHEMYIDFHRLPSPAAERSQTAEAFIVAVKKEHLNAYLNLLQSVQLCPVLAEITGFSLENIVGFISGFSETTAIVDIGLETTSVSVVANSQPIMARDLPIGGNQLDSQIQAEFGADPDEIELIKRGAFDLKGKEDVLESIITSTCTRWVAELKRTLKTNKALSNHPIQRMLLTGGSSNILNLAEFFTTELEIPTELFNPFLTSKIRADKSVSETFLRRIGPEAAIAAGIALRASDI